jgi:hypothetical protein
MTVVDDLAQTRAELAGLMGEFFRAVSFEPGESPPYHVLHQIFIPGARLIRNSGPEPEITGVEAFIEPRLVMVATGELTSFRELESGDITEIFGNIAHRLSMYQKRGRMDGVDFAARGVISTQFIRTPNGWRMSSMAWDDERPGLSIVDR